MTHERYTLLCARKYKFAVSLAKRYKDKELPKWISKKLKWALQDLKEACLKLDDRDAL